MRLIDTEELDEIVLPNGLLWVDEYTWSPIESASEWSLSGAMIIQSGKKLKGRPITLEGADEQMGWVTRETVEILKAKAEITDRKFTLVLGSGQSERQFTVRFRHSDNALEASPVYRWQPTDATAWFRVIIRLIEV